MTHNDSTALSGAYILIGFMNRMTTGGDDAFPEYLTSKCGQLDLINTLIDYAKDLEAAYLKCHEAGLEPPGCWEYEVSEPFGVWVADFALSHFTLPNEAGRKEQIETLTRSFYGDQIRSYCMQPCVETVSGPEREIRRAEPFEIPDFYSVYLRDLEGTSQCIADFVNPDDAEAFVKLKNGEWKNGNPIPRCLGNRHLRRISARSRRKSVGHHESPG